LTLDDYVPLKWSVDLERVARIRAAEASISVSHTRPNGAYWSTLKLSDKGVSGNGEVLAWNYSTSMVMGVNQWYTEKADWVNQEAGAVTGHYTQMINPANTYVGLGDFYSSDGVWRNTVCGRFSKTTATLDETFGTAVSDCVQTIEVKKSALSNAVLTAEKSALDVDGTTYVTMKATSAIDGRKGSVTLLQNISYTSSNESVLTVDGAGKVTAVAGGTAKITATSSDGFTASCDVAVTETQTKLANGDTVKVGKVQYEVDDADARTVIYKKNQNSKAGMVKIPNSVQINGESYKVVGIANNAFKGNTNVKRVTLGSNVAVIGNKAFFKCTRLQAITLPAKVKSIGKQAFYGCSKLKTVNVKTTKLSQGAIGSQAFAKINRKVKMQFPTAKRVVYKKLFKKAGVSNL
jgi:hypothetical protein